MVRAGYLRVLAAGLLLAAPFLVRSRYRQRFLNPELGEGSERGEAEIVAAMRDALRFNPFLYTCLERAGALHRMLHRYGFDSVLRIGVKPGGARIAAHAWVEYPPGRPLLDEEHGEFAVLQPPADMLR